MPTYAYACKDCGHNFEIVQSFSDDALSVCPNCSGNLRKVFNSVGVVFKGSGFYRNDSRDKKTSTTPAATSADSKTTKESSTGGDTSTAAKDSSASTASSGSTSSTSPKSADTKAS